MIDDWHGMNIFIRTGDRAAIDCPECTKEYACEVEYSVTFCSFPVIKSEVK
jgi:hypothetical protein